MITFVPATGWLLVVLGPLYYMILASLRDQGSYLTANPWVPAGGLSFANYGTVFTAGLGRYLLNSVIITVGCLVVTLLFSLAAAFRVVRTRPAGRPRPSACCWSGWPSRSRPSSSRCTCSSTGPTRTTRWPR